MRVNRPHIKTNVIGDRNRPISWLKDQMISYYKSDNPSNSFKRYKIMSHLWYL